MFTGIIEAVGTIRESRGTPSGLRMTIDVGLWSDDCPLGSSVCVSGVCLTVASADRSVLEFDVVHETLAKSALGRRRVGERVNLERSLRVGDRLDGHFVQGHVDGTAIVESTADAASHFVLRLRPQPHLRPFIIPKGAIAVEGVSLTIADLDAESFSVALIPTTLGRTNLAMLRRDGEVNIETDVVTRAVIHTLSTNGRGKDLSQGHSREFGAA
jgi:riboflavin synthase